MTVVPFDCIDGTIFILPRYAESMRQEREEGGLTVSRAYMIYSKWRAKEDNPGVLTRGTR